MTNLEHYFENLLYHGEDIKGEANKNALTEEQQKSVEQCAQYVIYSLFGTREHFDEWINRDAASPWHRVEEPPKEHGKYPVCWVENGNFYWQEAHYCYYQDGDKWVAWSSYQGDDVEITPDYWMPIEPPKEEV